MKKRDVLWAPWRSEYITVEKKGGCFLCKAFKSKGKDADRRSYILYRGKNLFVILNLFPYNNGHLMVVPNRHIDNIGVLSTEEEKELMFLIKSSVRIIKKTMNAQGFNIGLNQGSSAGAGLESHIHFHVVPRWAKDTNFITVISNSKVVSQSLDETYKLLKPEFDRITPSP
jgi:ATP adenylyltransferase